MTHVTCRLTAKYRDQLRNPMLGNRVWATFTFFSNDGSSRSIAPTNANTRTHKITEATDTHASKLSDILSCHSLHQHVYSPTHVHGHTLDLLITRDDQSVAVLPIDPPLLSDHAFVGRRLQLSAAAVYDLNRVSSSTQLARTRCRRLRRRPATVRIVSGTTSRP